jgi:hypothetical protein
VPFFVRLSAELQLGTSKGAFRKKVGNEDYEAAVGCGFGEWNSDLEGVRWARPRLCSHWLFVVDFVL